jgi:hypothetical protein
MCHAMFSSILASNVQNFVEIKLFYVHTGHQDLDGIDISLLFIYCT